MAEEGGNTDPTNAEEEVGDDVPSETDDSGDIVAKLQELLGEGSGNIEDDENDEGDEDREGSLEGDHVVQVSTLLV